MNQESQDKALKVEQVLKKAELEKKNKEAARLQLLKIQILLAQKPINSK